MFCSLLGSLLVKDLNFRRSTLEQTWAINFPDVKIPATNSFSKCEYYGRLKKMLHTSNIEAGHDLKEEDLGMLQHDMVDRNILSSNTTIFSIIRFSFFFFFFFAYTLIKQRRMQDNCLVSITKTFEENASFKIFKNKSQETRPKNCFSLKLTE